MKKLILVALITGVFTILNAEVKELYVGSTTSQGKQYILKCTNGRSLSSLHIRSNGYWYSGISKIGDKYRNASINTVANGYCR